MISTRPRTSRHPLPLVLAVVLVAAAGVSTKVEAESVTDHIRVRIEKIYDLLSPAGSGESNGPIRQAEARRLLDEIFDWDEMARRALGPHWNERTAAERAEFVDLFAELFRRTYLSRIELADREHFLYLDETVEGDSATVRTAIVTKKNHQIPVHYLTRRAGDQWKIYDLTVGGTSLVNNYRAQFTALVARSSYQDLVEKLRALVGKHSGAAPAGSFVLVGAGDIASCSSDGDEATATLLDTIDGTVFTTFYEHGAEIVLGGHDHVYERFAPQKPNGEPDPVGGVRQFVVGTGGATRHRFAGPRPRTANHATTTPSES